MQVTLTVRKNFDGIMYPVVVAMLSSNQSDIYQRNNARPHTEKQSQQYLHDKLYFHGLTFHLTLFQKNMFAI